MKKEENMVDFDLSTLSLSELITLHERVTGFLEYLNSQKKEEDKGGEDNE